MVLPEGMVVCADLARDDVVVEVPFGAPQAMSPAADSTRTIRQRTLGQPIARQ